ncbi:MAG: hypothetical protein AAF126_25220 [Chloroflexota bacterium]
MTRLLLHIMMLVFLLALAKIIIEGDWYLVVSVVVSIILCYDDIAKIFDEFTDDNTL